MSNPQINVGYQFESYFRHLPHWQTSAAIYFITWRIAKSIPKLTPDERSAVAGALEFFHEDRYYLLGYVVMDDHVHVLVRLSANMSLPKVIHTWKSYTANRLQRVSYRSGSVWQQEHFDRIVRDAEELRNAAVYIQDNAASRWPECVDYPWCKMFRNE
jgi:REP element-mobilizing transposase RayT